MSSCLEGTSCCWRRLGVKVSGVREAKKKGDQKDPLLLAALNVRNEDFYVIPTHRN